MLSCSKDDPSAGKYRDMLKLWLDGVEDSEGLPPAWLIMLQLCLVGVEHNFMKNESTEINIPYKTKLSSSPVTFY